MSSEMEKDVKQALDAAKPRELTKEEKQEQKWARGKANEKANLTYFKYIDRLRRQFYKLCGVVQIPANRVQHAFPVHPSTTLRIRGPRLRATSVAR